MRLNRVEIHRQIYIGLLILLVIAMPFSRYLMSNAIILLAINYFAEGKIMHKINLLKQRKSILVFVSIILIHFIWIFNSSNVDYAIHDIRIKIPLLVFPIIIGTTDLINKKELKIILSFFVTSVFVASIYSLLVYLGFTYHHITDYRGLSVFISHIRFSLMVVLSIFITVFYGQEFRTNYKYLLIVLVGWLLVFLFILHSLTGIFIFGITTGLILFKYIFSKINFKIKLATIISILIFFIASGFWLKKSIDRFYYIDNVNYSELEKYTDNGNEYNHDPALKQTENGHYIYIYRCEDELKKEWNTLSNIKYDSLDLRGNVLKFTLIRYLTSLDIRKDSAGVHTLTKNDIELVEKGTSNYLYADKFSPYSIVHKIMWEYSSYISTNNPNKNSLAQRIEFFKAGVGIFASNTWFGVGTGDVQDEFNNYYELNNSNLDKDHRFRAHNQFLTFLITFGLFGFILLGAFLIYPLFFEKNLEKGMVFIILVTAALSWLNEDAIETQVGVTIFAFFYALFVFGYKKKEV